MRYQIGDTVKIRDNATHAIGEDGEVVAFPYEMEQYRGQIATIVGFRTPYRYELDIDKRSWAWIDAFLEDAEADVDVDVGDFL